MSHEAAVAEIVRNSESDLPMGWVRTTLGEIAHVNRRDSALRDLPDSLLVSFVPMAAVDAERGTIVWQEERPISEVRKGFTSFSDGDVLFAKITPCMENGKAAVAHGLKNRRGFGSTEFHVLTPRDGVSSGWIFYFVRQQSFREDAKANFSGTAGQLRVPGSFLVQYPIALAPAPEQQRIVTTIEQHFSRLDAGVTALKQVQAKLKRYRSAVLKAAVEGTLTESWRAEHSDVEPASVLLLRILQERRSAWEQAELAKFAKAGKAPPKGWQAKYKEPGPPDTTTLPRLPKSWCWTTPEQLAAADDYSLAIGPFGSNLKVVDYRTEGVPLVFVRNIRSGVFDGPDTRYITVAKAEELRAHRVSVGDILITKMGDPPGDACLYPEGRPSAVITADCIKWTLSPALPEHRYFVHAIHSQLVKRLILDITKGVAQLKVSLGRFEGIAVPLPPLAEQKQIVAEVERRLSVVAETEAQMEAELKRAERLRQSILKQAFAGKLVPQDPEDEPAGVLLERIRSHRRAGADTDRPERAAQLRLV